MRKDTRNVIAERDITNFHFSLDMAGERRCPKLLLAEELLADLQKAVMTEFHHKQSQDQAENADKKMKKLT